MSATKACLVIGAGDATGGAIARRFAAESFHVCVARRTADKLVPLVQAIERDGGVARAFGTDARDEDQVTSLFESVEGEVGPVEVVVFNIGANVRFGITETTARVYRKVWEMACFSGFLRWRRKIGQAAKVGSTFLKDGLYDWKAEAVLG